MKVPKALLATIVVAVTAGTASSCSKAVSKPKQPLEIKKPVKDISPYSCPACGMG